MKAKTDLLLDKLGKADYLLGLIDNARWLDAQDPLLELVQILKAEVKAMKYLQKENERDIRELERRLNSKGI